MSNPTGDALVAIGIEETQERELSAEAIAAAVSVAEQRAQSPIERGITRVPLISCRGSNVIPSSAVAGKKT